MFKSGWLQGVKHIKSDNYNSRPDNCEIDLVVIHCISLPEGDYDNTNVEKLFDNNLDCNIHQSFKSLVDVKVSAHFYIKRNGEIIQFVSANNRAWHAGASEYKSRQGCNDFSIGIEMQGTDKTNYTAMQYDSLNVLLNKLKEAYPTLKDITGHEDIAPGRKTDPGSYFEWGKVNF